MLRTMKALKRFSSLIPRENVPLPDDLRRPPNYVVDRKKLDETLNLNSHIFSLENVDKQVNSRFIAKSRVGMIRQHATIALYNKMIRSSMANGPLIRLLRSEIDKLAEYKQSMKPTIEKKAELMATDNTGYEYLLQNSGAEAEIEKFLQAEMDYLLANFGTKGSATKFNYEGIMHEMPSVYCNDKYFCDGWKYFNGFGDVLDMYKEPIWNTESLLKDDKENKVGLINSNQLKEYMLEFKDDFSYFICRHLKNNDIMITDLRTIKVVEDLDIIALKLVIDNNEIVFMKKISCNKYYTAYFPNQIGDFWISQIKGKPSMVFKEIDSGNLKYIHFEDKNFVELTEKPAAIKSIGEYMKLNASKLRDNPCHILEEFSRPLYEAEADETMELDFYAGHLYLRSRNAALSRYNLWWLGENSMNAILVR